jgi:hypothetical protein
MAVDSYGDQNQPLFDGTKASNLAADLNAVSNFGAKVGNRKVGTAAARRALTGADVWDGLEYFETDSGDCYVYNSNGKTWAGQFAVAPTTSTSGYFTPSSGWAMKSGSNTGVQYITIGGSSVAQVYVSFYRTSSTTITVPTDGNLKNVTVGHVNTAPASVIALCSGANGRTAHFTIDSDGTVLLASVSQADDIHAGDGFSFSGLYLLG